MHFVHCRRKDTFTGTRLRTLGRLWPGWGRAPRPPVGPRPRLPPRPVVLSLPLTEKDTDCEPRVQPALEREP